MVEILGVAVLITLWFASGLLGVRMIVDAWFSGSLRDALPTKLDASYIVIGVLGGPINLVLAWSWMAMGMGRD